MRRWLLPGALLGGLLALAACAAKQEVAAPAPAAPAAPEAILPRKDAWQQEWERVLEAAKREGRVAVAGGPGGPAVRRAVTEPFERRYGISVEYLSLGGGELPPRIKVERDAGRYLWDVFHGGTTTAIISLKPMGALDPIEPALILPEVKEAKNWRGGELPFLDKDRLVFAVNQYTRESFIVNSNLVKPGEFKSYRDLLDPRWKGKIGAHDPRIPGGGQSFFNFLYVHKDLGPDFIRALAKQELTFMREHPQLLQWTAEGKYVVCLGCSGTVVEPMVKAGAALAFVDPRQMKEGGSVHSGPVGSAALVNRAPHPNAAKVYINWLLSKEGQTELSLAAGSPSTRLDVPTDHLRPWEVPRVGDLPLDGEEAVTRQVTVVVPFLREFFR